MKAQLTLLLALLAPLPALSIGYVYTGVGTTVASTSN